MDFFIRNLDKRGDFVFDIIANVPFLDGDVSHLPPLGFTFLNVFDLLECLIM